MNQPYTLDDLTTPSFLLCPPFTLSNRVSNNELMKKTEDQSIDYNKAFVQFIKLYRFFADRSLVYLLPHAGNFQDQSFVANLGIVLPHIPEPTVILSNFKSPPRWGEEKVGRVFFDMLKYKCEQAPYEFEGEADLKWIRNNIYIGGYPIRSSLKSYHWMEERYNCHIIPMYISDEKLYHFDCVCFPLSYDRVLLTTSVFERKEDIRRVEQYVDIVEVPARFAYSGMTNLCRIGDNLLCRQVDRKETQWFDSMCASQGLTPVYFPLGAFDPNGADLSCLVMHINRKLYKTNPAVNVGEQVRNFYNG